MQLNELQISVLLSLLLLYYFETAIGRRFSADSADAGEEEVCGDSHKMFRHACLPHEAAKRHILRLTYVHRSEK